ncbi:SgcJ/EcaC family oxidoreductase [Nocardiopsis coralliicola]
MTTDSTAATVPPALAAPADTAEHAADRAAIERIIADIERGFNGNDPGLLAEHFASDGTAAIATGRLLAGRDAIHAAAAAGLAGPLRDSRARYTVDSVTFVRSDVALVRKSAADLGADGAPTGPDPAMVALYVLVKQDGRWWIAARQNTLATG